GGEEFLQAVVEDCAVFAVGGAQLRGSLVLYRASLVRDLVFELFQALFVVAARFTHGQQVAALGIEQEEQAVQEGERPAEVWFEQVMTLVVGEVLQICWQQPLMAGKAREALCEVGKISKKTRSLRRSPSSRA